MGCKTDLPSKKPEVESSRIVTVADIEYKTECVCLHSVTIYNRLEPAPSQFRSIISNEEGSKMATGCDVDLETGAHNGPTESNVDLNETSERLTHLNQKDNVVSNEPNKTDLDQSDKDNITNIGEKGIVQASPIPVEVNHESASATSSGNRSDDKVLEEVLNDLDILKDRLKTATDIPSILLDVSLNCLKPSTIDYLSYHLDPLSDVMSPEDRLKDYRGLAEWIGLEPVFIKYISRSSDVLKTREILSKWLTREEEPLPILKNLRECLLAIDRPDVLEDMSVKMALDAVTWKRTQLEARTRREVHAEDTSWQLTRHDVVSGTPTNYTCCLVYADEDEGMVQIFKKLYRTVYPRALFFLPQFDLKQGKFIFETTAQVIEERCGGKVIFFLSEYFFASSVCRFTVNFCRDMDARSDQGNLIPFHLTHKYEHVPRVLKGIAGIRWFRKASRRPQLLMLADTLLGGKMTVDELEELKIRMETLIDRDSEYYLCDPPYDEGTPQPGDPISVYDPPPEVENSDDPSSRHFSPEEDECLMSQSLSSLEALGYVRRKSNLTRFVHYVQKKIFRRVFGSGRERRRPPLPSTAHQPPIEVPSRG